MKEYGIQQYWSEFEEWIHMMRIAGVYIPACLDSETEAKALLDRIMEISPDANVRLVCRDVSDWRECA